MNDRPIECGFKKIGQSAVNLELVQFKAMMDELGIEFFLTAGVLLGICRDGKLIDGDKDFDIGIIGEDALQKIYDSEKVKKYYDEIHYGNTRMNVPNGRLLWLKKYIGNYVIPIEIQAHYIKGNYVFYNCDLGTTWKFRKGRLVWERRLFDNFVQIEFNGHKFNAPNPPQDYFLTRYGCDWRDPQDYKDWRWYCRNIYKGFWE